MISRIAVTAAASALILATSTASRADWCETYPGSGKFTDQNCSKPGTAPARTAGTQQQQPAKPVSKLREEIREKLDRMSATVPASPRDRFNDASRRAHEAVESAKYTNDPKEKAQLKRKYDDAMRDVRSSGAEVINATADPREKEALRAMMADYEVGAARAASEVGFGGGVATPAPQQAATSQPAAAPALREVFTVCEPPERGVTTCFEIARLGNQCLKVYYQGGQRTWADTRTSACSPSDLAQRDDYYAGRPVGMGQPADPRTAQLEGVMASLSPRCQDDLRKFMYGSRDSASSRGATNQAVDGFRNVQSDPACKAGMERLAGILGVQLPRRVLADADRQAWKGAMAERPRETLQAPASGGYGSPSLDMNFDTGEVLDTGISLLNFLGAVVGVAGAIAGSGGGGGSTYYPVPSTNYGGPTGGGYVYRGSNRGSGSTITGGR